MYILFDILEQIIGAGRRILLFIESIGVTFIDNIYNLMIKAMTAFDGDKIADIAESVIHNCYIIVGIFALFRIALVLINTIIDPDKFTDKNTNIGNMLSRIVIVVVLLVSVQFVFDKSRDIQSQILENNYISKLLIGTSITGNSASSSDNAGAYIKDMVIRSLIYPDDRVATSQTTTSTAEDGTETSTTEYTCIDTSDSTCTNAVTAWNNDASFLTLETYVSSYIKGSNDETIWIYKYTPFIMLITGLFVTYVLLSFTIDIAIRTVELAVLEILSPFFIVTYIDPKSSSNGPFKRWLSACGKTYVSLFIKIAIICLMIFFISKINDLFDATKVDGGFLSMTKLLMLIAVLIFAKRAPKWLGDMIGIEGGLGGLGIGKKLGEMALLGGLASKGMEAGKKQIGKRAKRRAMGVINRIGADIGGTISGMKSAKQNALGDKSIAAKRQSVLNETGSKAKANLAAVRSFFSKKDRDERKDTLNEAREAGQLDLKAAGKEGRMDARLNATHATLNGEFKSAGSLYKSTREKYDPNYQTHDQRIVNDAEASYNANSGAFNMAEINRQKDLQEKSALASSMLGKKCMPNPEGKIVDASGNEVAFNAKTLKANYGSTISSWEGMAAVTLAHGNKAAFQISADVRAKDGSIIQAGSAVIKDAAGQYTKIASADEVQNKAEEIKSSYTSYGQKEMEAVFAERKLDNANQYIQTQQLANQTSQNIANLELDLAPLTEKLSKLQKAGEDMKSELKSLEKQKTEEKDFAKQAELSEKISKLKTAITGNTEQQELVRESFESTDDYLKQQKELLSQINEQSNLYNNPDNPIMVNDVKLNLANSSALLMELEDKKTKSRKIADGAKSYGGSEQEKK